MIIRREDGSPWLWIDHSKGEHELETDGDPVVNRQVQRYWNSNKKHKFKHDADFIEENFKAAADISKSQSELIGKSIEVGLQNAEHLNYHAENMRSHVRATQDLSAATKILNKTLEQQTELFKKLLQKFD